MEPIKFSVIGFGRIGQRHAKIIQEFEGTELLSVTDTDSNQFEFIKKLELKNISSFNSIDEFLQKDHNQSDIITIATPNRFHTEYAVKFLQKRYHVLIEKPMGLSVIDCEEVLKAEAESGRKVFVVKQNRYSPPSEWLKELVDKKVIGDTLIVQLNCYWNRDSRYYASSNWKGTKELDGGALFTQFSHFIDIMFWVFGDIKNPKAVVKNFTHPDLRGFDDSGLAQFEFENGGIGSINYSTSCWDKNMESSITVVGTKGCLKIGGQYMNEIEYCHIEGHEKPDLPKTNSPNDYGTYKGSAANHHYVFENIVNTLSGKAKPTATSSEGIKVVSIIQRIYEAANFFN